MPHARPLTVISVVMIPPSVRLARSTCFMQCAKPTHTPNTGSPLPAFLASGRKSEGESQGVPKKGGGIGRLSGNRSQLTEGDTPWLGRNSNSTAHPAKSTPTPRGRRTKGENPPERAYPACCHGSTSPLHLAARFHGRRSGHLHRPERRFTGIPQCPSLGLNAYFQSPRFTPAHHRPIKPVYFQPIRPCTSRNLAKMAKPSLMWRSYASPWRGRARTFRRFL